MRNDNINSPSAIAWILLFTVIIALFIITVDLIGSRIKKNRIKRNDNDIFKSVRKARRDFR